MSMCVFSLFSKGLASGFPDTRNARGKAPRVIASFRHSAVGCTHEPLPGSAARSSTQSCPSCITTRRSASRESRARHATQVRTASILPASYFFLAPFAQRACNAQQVAACRTQDARVSRTRSFAAASRSRSQSRSFSDYERCEIDFSTGSKRTSASRS